MKNNIFVGADFGQGDDHATIVVMRKRDDGVVEVLECKSHQHDRNVTEPDKKSKFDQMVDEMTDKYTTIEAEPIDEFTAWSNDLTEKIARNIYKVHPNQLGVVDTIDLIENQDGSFDQP